MWSAVRVDLCIADLPKMTGIARKLSLKSAKENENGASPARQAGNQFDCFQALEGLEPLHTYPIIFKNEDSFPPLKKKKKNNNNNKKHAHTYLIYIVSLVFRKTLNKKYDSIPQRARVRLVVNDVRPHVIEWPAF